MKSSRVFLLIIFLCLLVTGASAETFFVGMNPHDFAPVRLTITVGDSVTWTNHDFAPHSSTSGDGCKPDGIWDSGALSSGDSFTYKFTTAGTFDYFCGVTSHCALGMVGAIEVNPPALLLQVPTGLQVVPPYEPIFFPVLNTDPTQARPVALGTIATGGDTLTIQMQTYPFAGPMDVYFGLSVPALDPVNVYILTPTGLQTVAAAGLVPWQAGVNGPVSGAPLGSIPAALLPPATYNIFFAITPAGSLSALDLWTTRFTLPGK